MQVEEEADIEELLNQPVLVEVQTRTKRLFRRENLQKQELGCGDKLCITDKPTVLDDNINKENHDHHGSPKHTDIEPADVGHQQCDGNAETNSEVQEPAIVEIDDGEFEEEC